MLYEWDDEKNEKLKRERCISFEEIEWAPDNQPLLGKAFNPRRPKQIILLVTIDQYVWAVATEQRGTKIRLITAYQSRKFTKKYL
ncbi:MAG: BrnT family toxin [Verrucomicrobiae bacterium]|nr:BrnT family toxin [Verrucomicrobiae bacterium]